jgi:hypothetical protein
MGIYGKFRECATNVAIPSSASLGFCTGQRDHKS